MPDPLSFTLGRYLLQVPADFGPRVLGLRRDSGPELFAQLGPDLAIDRPDSGSYRFRGGHRLWASPEVPAITYASDDEPCQVAGESDRLTIEGPPDRAGLIKRLTITVAEEGLIVDHVLANAGEESIEIAPWAITQLHLGGIAVVPLDGETDPNRLQANASLVLWPYTDLADPRVAFHPGAVTVRTQAGPAFKIGTGPDPGRIGYLLDGQLFTKSVPPAAAGTYTDRGAVAQLYLGDAFCELETVGPLVSLEPGGKTEHREVWGIQECDDLDTALSLLTGGPG